KDLALDVSVPDIAGKFRSSSAVAHLILTNTSEKPLDVSKTWSRRYFVVQVEDAAGKSLEILDRPNVTIPPLLNDEELAALPQEIVHPGKTFTWQVNLRNDFPLQ